MCVCFEWFKRFREGHEDMEDVPDSGHCLLKIQDQLRKFVNWWPETEIVKEDQLHINQEMIVTFFLKVCERGTFT